MFNMVPRTEYMFCILSMVNAKFIPSLVKYLLRAYEVSVMILNKYTMRWEIELLVLILYHSLYP